MRLQLAAAMLAMTTCLGCSTTYDNRLLETEYKDPGKLYFVENHGKDKRHLDQVIAEELRARWLSARSGLAADRPGNFDVLVTYEDRWWWDMGNYLIFLRIDFREPVSNALLAMGHSYQTSLVRKASEVVVSHVIARVMGEPLPVPKTQDKSGIRSEQF